MVTMSTCTITTNDLLLVNSALLAFENPVGRIADGKEIRGPYDLSEKARYAIMRSLKKLKPILDEISAAREDMRIAHNPRGLKLTEMPEDKQVAWDQAHRELMMEEREIQLHSVNLSEFRLEKNPSLPSSVIATLLGTVIIDDAPSDECVEPVK